MNNNEKIRNKSLLYSIVLSMSDYKDYTPTIEDIRFSREQGVSECQLAMYMKVIEQISNGKTYEEIFDYIENIDINEFRMLNQEQQTYVKKKVKRDMITRRENERKGE